MKRPLVAAAAAMIWGIIISDVSNYHLWGIIAAVLSIIALIIFFRKAKYFSSRYVLLAIPFLCLGFLLHTLNSSYYNNRFRAWNGNTVAVSGYIYDEPEFKDGKIRFTLQTEAIENISIIGKALISVTLYSEQNDARFLYGSHLIISGELRVPQGKRNIGGFDSLRYYASKGTSGTLGVPARAATILEGSKINLLKDTGYKVRHSIVDALYSCMPSNEASVVAGMLIGYTNQMPEEMEENFRIAGLSHVLAVSGANVAFLLLPLMWFLQKIGLNRKWSSAISLPFLLFFVFATGMEASIIRAAIMAAVMLVGMILWRKSDVYCSLAASAIIILSFNTYMLFDIGFILSFLATMSLAVFYNPLYERLPVKVPKKIRDTLSGTVAAQIGVIPVIAYNFNTFSVVSILANLIVIPLTGILTLIGALVAIFGNIFIPLGRIIGFAARYLTDAMLWVTKTVSGIPWAELHFATPGLILVLAYYAVVLYLRYFSPRLNKELRKPLCAVILSICGLILIFYAIPSHRLMVYFTDVGQGDCILIKTPEGKNIILDGGGSINDEQGSYAGERIVVPALYDLNMTHIDMMIASHGHADHIGGLKSVIDAFKVEYLVVADAPDKEMNDLLNYADKKGIKIMKTSEGSVIYSEGELTLKTLYPFSQKDKMPSSPTTSANDFSIVARLDYGNFHALLTGDISSETEQKLIDNGALIDCNLLKIAHHGSKYSSSDLFLDASTPKVAIISVGKNRYGHPAPSTVERLGIRGIKVYETIISGGIMVETDNNSLGMSIKTVAPDIYP